MVNGEQLVPPETDLTLLRSKWPFRSVSEMTQAATWPWAIQFPVQALRSGIKCWDMLSRPSGATYSLRNQDREITGISGNSNQLTGDCLCLSLLSHLLSSSPSSDFPLVLWTPPALWFLTHPPPAPAPCVPKWEACLDLGPSSVFSLCQVTSC